MRSSIFIVMWVLIAVATQAAEPNINRQTAELRKTIKATYGINLPTMPIPVNNPQSPDKIKLGEALYFDPNLSACGKIACASCHMPEKGFSDGQQISDGCNGAIGRRNSNTVYNTGYLSHLFWDGRVQSLEQQALGPVVDGAEMANTWDAVIDYLKTGKQRGLNQEFPEAKTFYDKAFARVFGGEISTTTISKAIAAYERTVVSFNSPYDQWLKGKDKALNEAQKKGLLIFFGRGKCASCHAPPNFTDSDFHNLGVPKAGFEVPEKFIANPKICGGIAKDVDPGRGEIGFFQSSCSDLGKFKTPTLRNLDQSGQYMHNGVFSKIEEVMAHFEKLAKGEGQPLVGTLDPLVGKGTMLLGAGGGEAEDLKNLAEFLKALTGSQLKSPAGGIAPPK